jgi:hypothetical protein
MRPKILISAVIVIATIGVALAWRIDHANPTVQEAKQREVKVLVKQLETEPNGRVPVEIIQATATSSAPSVLDDVTYFLKNNSGKPISAVAVTRKVLFRENGKLYGNLRHSMVDFSFHPDLGDATGQSLVTVIPLLEERSYPEELKLSEDENLGANQYRRYLLKTLRTKGAADVEKAIKLKK